MTVELAFRFPFGRLHATPWGEHANEGGVEWPPSPWRMLRALYATWRARVPELDPAVVLGLLDRLAERPTYYLPRHAIAHTRHYLPGPGHKAGVTTDSAKVLDAFISLNPDDELVARWEIELDTAQRAALIQLARQLTYLGRADSVCDVEARFTRGTDLGRECRPTEDTDAADALAVLAADRPLTEDVLTITTTTMRTKLRRREPPGTQWVRYPKFPPGPVIHAGATRRPVGTVTTVRWSLASPSQPSKYAAVAWGDTLRNAAQSQYGRLHDRASHPTLSGKAADGVPSQGQHQHAHWLAFGAPDGRLLTTVAAWAPGGFDEASLDALAQLTRLFRTGISDVHSSPLGLEGWGSAVDVLPELAGPSRHWTSYTPFAPTRHPRTGGALPLEFVKESVTTELRLRGFPQADITVREPGAEDWHRFRRHRPGRERLAQARRVAGINLAFTEPVVGPIAIGALSHFGLGLFMPSTEH